MSGLYRIYLYYFHGNFKNLNLIWNSLLKIIVTILDSYPEPLLFLKSAVLFEDRHTTCRKVSQTIFDESILEGQVGRKIQVKEVSNYLLADSRQAVGTQNLCQLLKACLPYKKPSSIIVLSVFLKRADYVIYINKIPLPMLFVTCMYSLYMYIHMHTYKYMCIF